MNASQTPASPRKNGLIKIGLCGAILLLSLYLIITRSIPLGLSHNFPEAAFFFHSAYPTAVNEIAERTISETIKARQEAAAPKEEDKVDAGSKQGLATLQGVKDTLRKNILKKPLDGQAFRQLGQIAVLEDNPADAQRFMETATKLTLHEPTALYYLMLQALGKGKPKTTLYYADILMRSSVAGSTYAVPIVLRLIDYAPAREELVRLLSVAPPWRSIVLKSLPGAALTDPKSPFQLLRALRKTPNPPTQEEVDSYLTFLLNRKLYSLAYAAWLEFLPPDQTEEVVYLFNGSFERDPSGGLFNWTIGQGAEARASILPREDKENRRALSVTFGEGRATLPNVSQMIVLSPGTYHFRGQYMGELRARRGLQWRVRCQDGPLAGESGMLVGNAPDWRDFSFDFSIPAGSCAAQTVELVHMARSPSEQLATGSMWFDDLSITRVLDNKPGEQ